MSNILDALELCMTWNLWGVADTPAGNLKWMIQTMLIWIKGKLCGKKRKPVSSCRNQELGNKLREQAHASLRADSPQHHAFTATARAFETFRHPIFVADFPSWLEQVEDWLQQGGKETASGLICLDEKHKAKNLEIKLGKATLTGCLDLQLWATVGWLGASNQQWAKMMCLMCSTRR